MTDHYHQASTQRTLPGGHADREELPVGENGRALCRWCELEVPPRRRTFCSDYCVDQWRLRTDPGYLRDRTFDRDRGICAACGVDTIALFAEIKRKRGSARLRLLRELGLTRLSRKTLWDADHIVPVVEGGGGCDLSNIRTLCLRCHREATAQLRQRLRSGTTPPDATGQ